MNNFNSSILSKTVSREENKEISAFTRNKPSFLTDKGAGMLVVIDPRVDAYQMLAEGVHKGANVLILDPRQDGIEQITQALAGDSTSTNLHIICHGAPGTLHLGKTFLNTGNLEQYRQQLEGWGVAEILFYACNLAAIEEISSSQSFLSRFHQLTGAKIAASAHKIGNVLKGGWWYLEYQIGQISSGLAFESAVMQAYPGVFPVMVTPTTGLITSEDGATQGFSIVLSAAPTSVVTVLINNTDTTEGTVVGVNTVSSTSIRFSPTNWFNPRIFQVIGVDDGVNDGDILYDINITSSSADPAFDNNVEVVQVTNLDNDPPPNLSIDNVTVDETAGMATFTVSLDQVSGQDVMVDFTTNAVTANDPADFTGNTGMLTIPAGQTFTTISIPITDDALDEIDETFTVDLTNAVNATIIDPQGVGTIIDDDPTPNLSIDDVTVDETAGTAIFTVSLDAASGQDVTVDFATVAGTAINPDDFIGNSGTLTIAAGNTTGTIMVNITDDVLNEPTENFTVELSNATNANITDAQGLGTINDNDPPPELSINDVTVNEGAGTATFTVSLNQASGQDVTVNFTTNDGSAINPDDFTGTNGTLTIAAGDTTGTITVDINDDTLDEANENFTVDLSNATNATIADAEGLGTITDNDLLPNVSISDVTVNEGAGVATFTVSLDQASGRSVIVDFTTNDGSAINPDDFTNATGTVTIAPGETSATVSVPIINDTLSEADEMFTVTLSNPVRANIVDPQGIGTIIDDDLLPSLSIDDVIVDEGAGTATFTVSLSQASGQDVTVDFNTIAGTAEDLNDLIGSNSTLTIAAGDTTGTITVSIIDDALNEPNETFTVELSNATNATIADAEGLGIITDNDAAPNLSINDVTVNEAAGTATFMVTLDQASGQDVTVDFTTNDGSAINPDDFSGTMGTLTIAAGETSGSITVDINDDTLDEANENFTVDLTNATNATIADAQGEGTIIDNDLLPNLSINDVMVNEAAGIATFTVSLDQVSGRSVLVDFTTMAGTAVSPDDFTDTTGTVTIAAGETSATVSVPIISDALSEADETFTVNLSNAVRANIVDPQGIGTITDNNVPPSLSIDNVTVDEGAGTASFTVSLSQVSGQDITVDFATIAGTAVDPDDFTGDSGTLTILAGDTTGTITVDIIDDAIDELNENFTVELSNATNATIANAQGLGTITDNDAAPNLSINDVTVNEGAGTATFTVTLDQASGQDVTVNFATNDDTAINPDDFTGTNGTLTIAAGDTTGTITVDIVDDTVDEVDETFTVDITSVTNATIADNQGIGTITDNDLVPNISISDVTVDEAAGIATFTVSLDQVSGRSVLVDFSTLAGTAIAPDDFTDTTGTVTIAAGQTSAIISVPITNDLLNEADETFTVNLSNAIRATIIDPQGVGTITDDDSLPNLSIDDVTVDETAGTATFTVSLDQASGQNVTVDFATIAGTAVDPDDFTGTNGTLTILAGDTTGTITVNINDDALDELNETFTVELSNATNATIADAEGLGTITDDDAAPNLSINDVTVNEGAGTATFTVTLDQASGQDVTLDFITNDGTAINPDDFTGTNGTLTIAAGDTTGTITVDIVDDAIDEVDETFTVDITSATNATITNNQGVGTITDNDLAPNLSIDDVMVSEDAGTAIFTVSLDQASSQDVTVDFTTNDGSAVDPDDFTGTTGSVTIAAGQTSTTISIPIISDTIDEVDETFTVNLSNAVNANISDPQGVGTITDNNLPPNLSIDNVTVDEAAGTATFTVSLDRSSGQDITVDFATIAGTATETDDFTANNGTLTILAGDTTGTITVDIIDDALDEPNETFTVELSNATNATIADAQGLGTITDDDAAPNLSINDLTVNEGAGTATFTVTLDAASGQDVTVDFMTNDDSAISPDDFTSTSGTLTIAAGETTGSITVDIVDDAIDEVDETFTVDILSATNATITDNQGVGTITDNDLPPNLSISDVTVDEAGGIATFTVSLDQVSARSVLVDFSTVAGTAIAPDDFTDTTGTVTIAAGQTSAIISVPITNDLLNEVDETFTVNLSNAIRATILDPQGVGTITDDDPEPNLSIDDVMVDEDAGTATFTVSLSQASGQDITVDFATIAGTAISPDDFTGNSGTLTIFAGDTTGTITVDIIDDALDEPIENFTVELSNATNATIADAQGMGAIIDNDLPPNLSINDVTVNEGAGTATFTVTLDAASGQDVTVDFMTSDGTAINPDDYTGTNGTLTIAAGETTGSITVDIIDDAIDERNNENFTVDLIGATNATITDNQGVGTITDNDQRPNLSINDVTVDEAAGIATFTVSLDQASGRNVRVDFNTTAGTAVTPDDFTNTTGTLIIAAGQTSGLISVPIINDLLSEGDETFTVNLSNAVNATIVDPQGLGTITDDETSSNLSINDVTVDEAAGTATFTVSLDQASTQDVTVDFTTNDGTAVDPDDFTDTSGTLTIAAGQTTGTITVDIIDDGIDEADETFTVDLSNATNATITDAQGLGTITDNDTLNLNKTQNDVIFIEGGSGETDLLFTLDQSNALFTNEVGVFVVDDDQGTVNGVAPGSANYLETVLNEGQVIFTGLGLNELTGTDTNRQLSFDASDRLGFYLVQNDTTDNVLADLAGGSTSTNVFFTFPSGNSDSFDHLQLSMDMNNGTITLNWEDTFNGGDQDFDDMVVTVQIAEDAPPLGTGLQGDEQGELIDLRDEVTGLIAADFITSGTADFDDSFGFYVVDDASGSIGGVTPDSANYAALAVSQRLDLTQGLPGGSLLAPFFIADGTAEEFLTSNSTNQQGQLPQAYFSFLGANPDNADHLVRLGDNVFGFEDRTDFDYNDLIVQVNFT
ncbi:MAG: DUF4347 domain-containing protein [Symploca sp. SIO2C1]|nr:DUF4347 domain-containing protein [Symploca sp. SIO2C1]